MKTVICDNFIDFLGFSAKEAYPNGDYHKDLCCYLGRVNIKENSDMTISETLDRFLSAASSGTLGRTTGYTDEYTFNLAKYTNNNNISFRYNESCLVETDSDTESDEVTCYEQIFDISVSAAFSKSPWFGPIWNNYSSYTATVTTEKSFIDQSITSMPYSAYLQNLYLTTNNISGSFKQSDYYTYNVDTTPIVHDRSNLIVSDANFNKGYKNTFNTAIFCLNKNWSEEETTIPPSSILVSVVSFEHDMNLGNIKFGIEHSETGLVTLQ